ncbi:MAG: NAD(P)-binding protein [Candidatus Bathyarchaeia archaeon]
MIDKRGTPQCRATCPAGINVQGYVALISQGKFAEAYALIKRFVPFPAVLGRVCFRPCETECERGKVDEPIAICALKRFAADHGSSETKEKTVPAPKIFDEKVAIIGAGPAGLTAAYELTQKGYPVTVFESLPQPGGMLRFGIPEYRLPRNVLDAEIEQIRNLGVEIKTSVSVGKDFSIDEIQRNGYKAIFVATGAHKSLKIGLEDEETIGVIQAIDFLRDANQGREVRLGERIAVIGGGNVAIDASRMALRQGAKSVSILYRRSRNEMPAYPHEVKEAEKEGVEIHFLVMPKKILHKNGHVYGVECNRLRLDKPDESGRRSPVPIEGSEFVMEIDTIIEAIGQSSDLSFLPDAIKITGRKTVSVDPLTFETTLPGVFAGGDVVLGPASVIEAIANGKKAAISIDRYLRGDDLRTGREQIVKKVEAVSKEDLEKRERKAMPLLPITDRVHNFREVETGFTEQMAIEEAKRCLSCGGCSECLQCEKVCEANAIIHEQKDEYVDLHVGAIVVATGFEMFDAHKKGEYGYGKFDNVITGLEFERLINAGGPTSGELKRPSDGRHPEKIAFIQCVGSRDQKADNLNCSRVCCMYAIKQAVLIKEHMPNTDVSIFYIDIRAYGKGFEEFYRRAEEEFGIHFIRGAVGEVWEHPETKNLSLRAEDSDTGELLDEEFDLIILSVGLSSPKNAPFLEDILKVTHSSDGYFATTQPEACSVLTPVEGVFIAGAAEGPKDIPDSIAQASAAAMKAAIVANNSKPAEGI